MRARVKWRKADATNLLGRLAHMDKASDEILRASVTAIAEETKQIAVASMDAAPGPSAPGSAPHRQTGELADSIDTVVRKLGPKYRAKVGTSLVKGYFLEFGRSNMEPRPWLFPAFEQASQKAEQFMLENAEALL